MLRYTENVSKNKPGGLKHCKIEPKIIEHCANAMSPERCRSQYYEKYVSICPPISERKSNSFYLTPLKKPKNDVWYSTVPVGHNTLRKTVSHLCSMAGIQRHTTNHSLRVTTATILFHAGVDEQLIMKHTGHRSLDGVCLYKRVLNEQDREISEILNNAENTPVKKPKMENTGIDEDTSLSQKRH